MKLSVIKGFIDKDTMAYHKIGDVVEYPEKRAKEIEYKGFGKCLDEPKPTKVETKREEPKRPRNLEQPKRDTRRK